MIKGILFDLDGTLLNTLSDLNNALNYTLTQFNLDNVTISQTRDFIGNGVKNLIRKASFNNIIDIDKAYEVFTSFYRNHIKDYTTVYDNVLEMLKTLKQLNIKMAVVSNKYQQGVNILAEEFLSEYIDVFVGSSETVKVKPSSDMVNIALDKLNLSNDQCVFVGDSDVDIITGKNNNMKTIAVSYGYKDIDIIKLHNPDYIIDNPMQLIDIIKGENNE